MTFDWHWPAFFTRVTAGLLFGMAGVHKVFIMTPQVHTRNFFLEPYQHTWIPHFLLWSLGVGIPFLELIAGWLLVVGFLRRRVAIGLGFLLLTVTNGHALLVFTRHHFNDSELMKTSVSIRNLRSSAFIGMDRVCARRPPKPQRLRLSASNKAS